VITADEYQQATAQFDNHCDAWREDAATFGLSAEGAEAFVAAIGLVMSIGKVSNRAERQLRRSAGMFDFEALKLELGDVLWNVARLADEAGWTMSEVMQANIDKLTARYAERNTPTTSIEEVSSHGGQTPSSAMVSEGGPGEG
jgi:NTP pyrophosphatase (non-canonical NTP hydrolase)